MMLLFFANVEAIFCDCQFSRVSLLYIACFHSCVGLLSHLLRVSPVILCIWSEKVTCALAPSTQAGSLSPTFGRLSVCINLTQLQVLTKQTDDIGHILEDKQRFSFMILIKWTFIA